MACLTAWHLHAQVAGGCATADGPPAALGAADEARVESTAPALLAGLERLLAIDDLMHLEDLDEILNLAKCQLPRLFPDRSGSPTRKVVSYYALEGAGTRSRVGPVPPGVHLPAGVGVPHPPGAAPSPGRRHRKITPCLCKLCIKALLAPRLALPRQSRFGSRLPRRDRRGDRSLTWDRYLTRRGDPVVNSQPDRIGRDLAPSRAHTWPSQVNPLSGYIDLQGRCGEFR